MNILQKIKMLGPGIMLTAMISGRTHVVLLPAAGAHWGFALLWVVVAAYFFNYFFYDLGVRYIGATGNSIITAWMHFVGRYGRWVLWVVLAAAFALTSTLVAAYVSILGTITLAMIPNFPGGYAAAGIAWVTLSALIILLGKYKGLEWLSKAFMIVLFLSFAIAFFVQPPSISAFSSGLVPTFIPITALAFLVPMMAMPGSPADVFILSSWIMEKKKVWQGVSGDPIKMKKKAYDMALLDLRVGMFISFAVAIFIISLAGTVLYPDSVPVGIETMVVIANMFTETIGPWMYPLFMIGVLVAITSSIINAVDGASRLAGRVINGLKGKLEEAETMSLQRILPLVIILALGTTFAIVYAEPVFLTIIAGALYLIMYPLSYYIHYWACKNLIEEEELRPKKISMVIAMFGIGWVTVGMILTAYIFATGIRIY